MKAFFLLFVVALARANPVDVIVPREDVLVPVTVLPVVAPLEEVRVETNAQDPSALLSEPIDKATKLIIDLDEHIRQYLPSEDEVIAVTTGVPVLPYAGNDVVSEVELSLAERQDQIPQMAALIDQVNRLAESIESTITDLVSRRRYVTAAMLRSMLNYVRRVRVNLERLQNRLQSVAAVATSGSQAPTQGQGSVIQGGPAVPGQQFFITIRDRVTRITEEIGALVSRIRGSFSPAGTGPPLPPLSVTSAPGSLINAQGAQSVQNVVNAVQQGVQAVAAAVSGVVAQDS